MAYSAVRIDAAARLLQAALPGLHYDVARAWVRAEQGANNNVLGVTYYSGGHQHLYTYPTMALGIAAAARLVLTSGHYGGIRQSLKGGSSAQQAAAIVNSPWNGHHYSGTNYAGGLRNIAGNLVAFQTPSGGQTPPPSGGGSSDAPGGSTHDSRPPGSDQWLAGWNGIVSFPVGHVITQADVDTIMARLDAAGYFNNDPLGLGKDATRKLLEGFIGQAWNKDLQDRIQQGGEAAAKAAGDPFGGVSTAIGGIGDSIVKIATYGFALVLIVVGLFIYSRRGEGVPVPSVVP